MLIANQAQVDRFTGKAPYPTGAFHDADAARVNAAVVSATNGKLPCYAIPGKRAAFKWVSVGSSCVIGRSVAASMLARCGADIATVEAA